MLLLVWPKFVVDAPSHIKILRISKCIFTPSIPTARMQHAKLLNYILAGLVYGKWPKCSPQNPKHATAPFRFGEHIMSISFSQTAFAFSIRLKFLFAFLTRLPQFFQLQHSDLSMVYRAFAWWPREYSLLHPYCDCNWHRPVIADCSTDNHERATAT
jgi:hypothetical protein